MLKIAVTGEGPTDYGRQEYGSENWVWGPIKSYICKIAEENGVEIQLVAIARPDVQRVKLQRIKGLKGKAIPSRKFAILMKQKECDCGIYYSDADKRPGLKSNSLPTVKRLFEEVYDEIKEGLHHDAKAIPMVALHMIESWILSDEAAYKILYNQIPAKPGVPLHPELLWGEAGDPDSNYPKHYLERIIHQIDKRFRNDPITQDTYCEIASHTGIETLRKKCPISFEKFYSDFTCLLDASAPQG